MELELLDIAIIKSESSPNVPPALSSAPLLVDSKNLKLVKFRDISGFEPF